VDRARASPYTLTNDSLELRGRTLAAARETIPRSLPHRRRQRVGRSRHPRRGLIANVVCFHRAFSILGEERKGAFCKPVPKCDGKVADLASIQLVFSAIISSTSGVIIKVLGLFSARANSARTFSANASSIRPICWRRGRYTSMNVAGHCHI